VIDEPNDQWPVPEIDNSRINYQIKNEIEVCPNRYESIEYIVSKKEDKHSKYYDWNQMPDSIYFEYSTSLQSDHKNDRTELSEINIANEINKTNNGVKVLQSFATNNSSIIKETRPRVWEYTDRKVGNLKAIKANEGIRKSAEFTFNFSKPDQPYFSNRIPTNTSQMIESELLKQRRLDQSHIQLPKSRPKSSRTQKLQSRSKSELKAEYEILRSEALDKESARMRVESSLQKASNHYK
jgi:hypothetical protein